jgi:hypothetical protein
MGCGTSVPKVIIPDPTPGQECKVLFKKTVMMSRDQYVYQDMDKEKKWLLMDKEGSLFSNPSYVLENFVRGKNPSKKDQGECLCAAKLEVTDAKTYGHHVKDDSDSSTASSGEWIEGLFENTETAKMKWRQAIVVKFYSDRDHKDLIAKIKVKAKGKAKKTTKKTMETVTSTDADGNQQTQEVERVQVDIHKKCNKVKYTITELKGEDEKELPKIKLIGKPNGKADKLKWESPLFVAEIDTKIGYSSDQIEVHTNWKNPALGMLMGYIIAKDISPDDIKDKVVVW